MQIICRAPHAPRARRASTVAQNTKRTPRHVSRGVVASGVARRRDDDETSGARRDRGGATRRTILSRLVARPGAGDRRRGPRSRQWECGRRACAARRSRQVSRLAPSSSLVRPRHAVLSLRAPSTSRPLASRLALSSSLSAVLDIARLFRVERFCFFPRAHLVGDDGRDGHAVEAVAEDAPELDLRGVRRDGAA